MSESEQTFKFEVVMSCSGCSGAIERVLKRAKDKGEVSWYLVDLAGQVVFVTTTLELEVIQDKIKKTGKEVKSGAPATPEEVEAAKASEAPEAPTE